MNRFEIRDILNQHKAHFRILPTLAWNALDGIIDAVDEDDLIRAKVAKLREEKSVDLGNRANKAKKKSKRSRR